MTSEVAPPSLQRSKKFATIALIVAIVIWLGLLIAVKLLPEYAWLIHILMLSAEAGVVGGLADWYAITVLFRNPFGKIPIPKFLKDHTEIIPRNKARIAESMGRFVQENFLSPQVVKSSLQKIDLSFAILFSTVLFEQFNFFEISSILKSSESSFKISWSNFYDFSGIFLSISLDFKKERHRNGARDNN